MNVRAFVVLVALGLVALTGCAPSAGELAPSPPLPPLSAEEDRTAYNNAQVALYVSQNPGWQAWLDAMQRSNQANNALVDASRYNTPVTEIIQAITAAQDAYRVATSFHLTPFTVTSSCLDLPSETQGSVPLPDGLTVRYGFLLRAVRHFDNGSECRMDTGFINEVDSPGGLPIAVVAPGQTIEWQQSFSRYLAWSEPFRTISTGTALSRSDLMRLIEQ